MVRDDTLELGEPDADRVVHFACEKLLFLDHGLPELGLARHDRVENARVVVDGMVLLENPDAKLPLNVDLTGVPIFLAGKHLEQRRFARAVRARHAVALSGVELHIHVLEKDLRPIALGDVVEDNHRRARAIARAARRVIAYLRETRARRILLRK